MNSQSQLMAHTTLYEKDWEGEQAEKAEFLAVCEACKAIFWLTPGLQEETFDSRILNRRPKFPSLWHPTGVGQQGERLLLSNVWCQQHKAKDNDSRLLYYLIREIKMWPNINHITVHNNTYFII